MFISINSSYLKEIVKKTGMTQKKFSAAIGQGEKCIPNAINRGTIRKQTAELICRLYGADFEKLTTPEPEERTPLYSDDKSVAVLVNTLIRIEQKLDMLIAELH